MRPARFLTKTLRIAALAALLAPGAAFAAGDAESGLALAKQWCASCHIVAANAPGGDTAPPFPAIAARKSTTEGGLRAWLTDPHPPMPNLQLSRQQIDDIVAYLEQLRPKQ